MLVNGIQPTACEVPTLLLADGAGAVAAWEAEQARHREKSERLRKWCRAKAAAIAADAAAAGDWPPSA